MSYPAMAWARKVKTGSATNKSVLLAVANYADENGECWPSQERLAEDTELSRRSIMRALDDLEKAEYLVRERRHRSDGSRKSDLIKLSLSDTVSSSIKTLSDTAPSLSDNLSKPKCHSVTAEPSIEPSIEPSKKDISYDQDFAEFWAAYPKRPNNSKAAAKVKYARARKQNVSHETIMAGVKAYAAIRNAAVASGDNPHFTQMAETWLNKAGWENDYTEPVNVVSKLQPAMVDDETLDQIVAKYPGIVSDRNEAKKIMAAEMQKGVKIDSLVEAVHKYQLHVKEMKYRDTPVTPPILEIWLKFKWREMDVYVLGRDPLNGKPKLKAAKK